MSSFDVVASGTSEGDSMEDVLDSRALGWAIEPETGDLALAEAAKYDSSAFGELYERYYARIYRYVYHRTGNAADAEDITAQVFMKALEALSGFQPRRNGFAPWIFRIARNAVVDHYRRRRKQTSLESFDGVSKEVDPVGNALQIERRHELLQLLEQLSADQRDVVLMRYAADLSFTEIAAAMGKKEPAIRMLLHRGLRKLKVVLEHE